MGGRNQEFALAAAMEIDHLEKILILSAGTGRHGWPPQTPPAPSSMARPAKEDWPPVSPRPIICDNNDAYPFFDSLGDLLKTGAH